MATKQQCDIAKKMAMAGVRSPRLLAPQHILDRRPLAVGVKRCVREYADG
jgi:hypothetical protein